MIRHIVMWKLRSADDVPRFVELLEACRALVPGIVEFEVGVRSDGCEGNVDVVLNSLFADAAALDAYQAHPQHQAVGVEVRPMREARHVLDYAVERVPS